MSTPNNSLATKRKKFDENCLYLTKDNCRTKHTTAVAFLRGFFKEKGYDCDKALENVYATVGITDSEEDYLIYIGVEQSISEPLVEALLQEAAPCFVVSQIEIELDPTSTYFLFFTTQNVKTISGYLDRHGFYMLDMDKHFKTPAEKEKTDGLPMQNAEENTDNSKDVCASLSPDLPEKEKTPVDLEELPPIDSAVQIDGILSDGFLHMPGNLAALTPKQQDSIRKLRPAATVVLSETAWKQQGYRVTALSSPLYTKAFDRPSEALYDQRQVSRIADTSQLSTDDKDQVLRDAILRTQNILRENQRLQNTMPTSDFVEHSPESLKTQTTAQLTSTLLAMATPMLHATKDLPSMPEQQAGLVEKAINAVLFSDKFIQQLLDAPSREIDTKTLAQEIAQSGVPILPLFAAISEVAQILYAAINENAMVKIEQQQSIERAAEILQAVTPKQQIENPALNANAYKNPEGKTCIDATAAQNIINTYEALQTQNLGMSLSI